MRDFENEIKSGHVDAVKNMLAAGADPNRSTESGGEPLRLAAAMGQNDDLMTSNRLDIVRALIQAGADVNSKDSYNRTPLFNAACADTIQVLLDADADVHLKDDFGITALMENSAWGHNDSVKALLAAGADPNVRDREDRTALMFAVSKAETEVVQTLLEANADTQGEMPYPDVLYDDEGTCIKGFEQCSQSNEKIARLIEDHDVREAIEGRADIEARDEYGNTMLMQMIRNYRIDNAKALLEAGADTTIVNRLGETAEDMARGEAKSILVAHRERLQLRQVAGIDENAQEAPRQRRKM